MKTFNPSADEITIMIVDDDHATRLLIAHALEREGYRLCEAADGAAAVKAFEMHRPDLILMDTVMPVMDGFVACRMINEIQGGEGAPILMVTGLDDERSVDQAFESGAVDFIPKPVNWAVLRQRVRRILAGKRAEKDISHLAFHDTLTGLPNRRLFLDRLGTAVGRADRAGTNVALMFLDLDKFKAVNDTMGHEAGDTLLRTVADRLVSAVRDTDTVARLGGDEFTVILEGIHQPGDAAGVAKNILAEISKPLIIAGQELVPHSSVGVAMFPIDGRDIGTLLKHADMAMYRAKEIGRDRYQFFTSEMGTSAVRRGLLEMTLHEALTCKQLSLVYTPRIDVASGRVIATECLLRWEHPELGIVPPNEFLGIAEESGQAVAIGDWVMREACRQLAEWHAAGEQNLRMAINVSVSHLRSRGLVRRFEKLLREFGLAPADIDLEISERAMDRITDAAAEALYEMCALGVDIALDDFGTGHTSLLALRRLPVKLLKLDKSYVGGLPRDPDCVAIASAVASMANNLGLGLVAEGVETLEQLAFIRELGCPQAEGYLFAKPVSAAEFDMTGRVLDFVHRRTG